MLQASQAQRQVKRETTAVTKHEDAQVVAAVGSPLEPTVVPAAWAVMAFGRVQKLVVRADVADELACKWRESDPDAAAVPLYTRPTGQKEAA